MAFCRCQHHRPKKPHYRTYAQPLAYLELLCSVEGCKEQAQIWLNPEEVKNYERGSRLFHSDAYDGFKVDGRGLNTVNPNLLRWLCKTLRPKREAQGAKPGPKARKKFET